MAENEEQVSEDGAADGEEEAKGGSKKFLFIIIGAVLLLGGGGGAGAYFFLFNGPAEIQAEEEETVVEVPKSFFTLPEMMVNLNNLDGKQEYLKVIISLELKNQQVADAITPKVARIQDVFQVYLRELRQSDIEGSAGIYRLKEELRKRVNIAVHPHKVDDILFKEILVQ